MDLESEDGYSAPPPGTHLKEERTASTASAKRPVVPKRESSNAKKPNASAAKKASAAKEKAAGKAVGRAVKKVAGGASAKNVAKARVKWRRIRIFLIRSRANTRTKMTENSTSESMCVPLILTRPLHRSLLNLPEIEREQILADRAEERQKHLDSLALGELYKATRGDEADDDIEEPVQNSVPEPAAAAEDDESEAMDLVDSDEDAEGEPENEAEDLGQRREYSLLYCFSLLKHPSAGVAKPEHKNRAMAALNEKRKQRADRVSKISASRGLLVQRPITQGRETTARISLADPRSRQRHVQR